jgi:hypothetical protein
MSSTLDLLANLLTKLLLAQAHDLFHFVVPANVVVRVPRDVPKETVSELFDVVAAELYIEGRNLAGQQVVRQGNV